MVVQMFASKLSFLKEGALACTLIVTLGTASWVRQHLVPERVIQKTFKSVVVVRQFSPYTGRPEAMGTGVVVSKAGYILTAAHVVEVPGPLTVQFYGDTREYRVVKATATARYDVAVLKLIDVPRELTPLKLFQASSIFDYTNLVGGTIYVIGHPAGLTWSVSSGIVSQVRAQATLDGFVVQTSAATNSGNSGGPVITKRGEVLGIVSFMVSQSGDDAGLNFFIPSIFCIQLLQTQRLY